ncbi:MAG: TolC family protein [Bacteroidaceae bacterium]|nr:TolC family protein [Bacteroidaceae bacterium]
MQKIIITVVTAAMLTSCGIMKKYERPTDISAENLYGDAQIGNDTTSLGTVKWREMFTDYRLQALIEEGLRNATMQTIDLRIHEMEVALSMAKIAWIPTLTFAPTGTVQSFDWASPATKSWQAPIKAQWTLGSYGSLTNQRRKAEANLEQIRIGRQQAQAGIVAGVANLYYTLCMLDEQVNIANETEATWKEMLRIQKQLMDAGMSNEAAVAQYEANYVSVKTQLLELTTSRRKMENSMCSILGRTPGPIERATMNTWQAPQVLETGVPLLLLARRPDVRLAEMDLATAYYAKNEARAAFFPSLTLSASLGWSNNNGTVNPAKILWNAIGSLTQPIFQSGRLIAQYKISKDEMEVAKINFQQALIDAGNEVNSCLADMQDANEKTKLYAEQVAALERACKATEALSQNSSGYNYLNVLTARNSLFSAQISELRNRYNCIQYTIALYQALGGGGE